MLTKPTKTLLLIVWLGLFATLLYSVAYAPDWAAARWETACEWRNQVRVLRTRALDLARTDPVVIFEYHDRKTGAYNVLATPVSAAHGYLNQLAKYNGWSAYEQLLALRVFGALIAATGIVFALGAALTRQPKKDDERVRGGDITDAGDLAGMINKGERK